MAFEEILARCLDALEQGETIEHCLARYPEYATNLAPILQLATVIRSTPQPRLSPGAYTSGRAAVIAQAHAQQSGRAAAHPMRATAEPGAHNHAGVSKRRSSHVNS